MTEFGRKPSPTSILRASRFMLAELPVRLAHRVVELENLPHSLSNMSSVIKVKNWYTHSFKDLDVFPNPSHFGLSDAFMEKIAPSELNDTSNKRYFISDQEMLDHCNISHATLHSQIKKYHREIEAYNQAFTTCLENIKKRHDPVVPTLAQGVLELKEHWKQHGTNILEPEQSYYRHRKSNRAPLLPVSIQAFLDRFYLSRIGIRMLIGQHLTLSRCSWGAMHLPSDYVGIICTKTNIRQVAEDAIENAKFVCQEHYDLWTSPDVKLVIHKENVEFSYVPSHLHHMLFELLKNSLRAVVERYGVDCDDYPDIKIIVAEGQEDITIKVSDEGGGIPRSGTPLIWTYMYTTANNPLLQEDPDMGNDYKAPLAGFGYGLPLSRLYARYFGGDLKLISMDGYGTDAYLHLSRLDDSEEPLP